MTKEERLQRLLKPQPLTKEARLQRLLGSPLESRQPEEDQTLGTSMVRQFTQSAFLKPAIAGLKFAGGVSKKVSDIYLPERMEQPVRETLGYRAGSAVEQFFEKQAPIKRQEQWPVKFAGVGGYMAGIASTGAVGATTRLGMLGAKLTTMLYGAFSQAGSSYDEALQKTGDPDVAFMSGLHGLASGSSEIVVSNSIGRIMAAGVPKGIASKVGQRLINRGLKGVGQAIAKGTTKGLIGGVEEGTQEGLQALYEGMSAKQLYDESRNIRRDVVENAGMGFIVGFLLNAAGVAISLKLRQPNIAVEDQTLLNQAQEEVEQAKVTVAEDLAQRFEGTTPEYWQEKMTQPEAAEIDPGDATQLARQRLIEEITGDAYEYNVDKQVEKVKRGKEVSQETIRRSEANAEAVKAHLKQQALGITGQAQAVEQQEYETQAAERTAEYEAQVENTSRPKLQEEIPLSTDSLEFNVSKVGDWVIKRPKLLAVPEIEARKASVLEGIVPETYYDKENNAVIQKYIEGRVATPEEVKEVSEAIRARNLAPRGILEQDVIIDKNGKAWVIDTGGFEVIDLTQFTIAKAPAKEKAVELVKTSTETEAQVGARPRTAKGDWFKQELQDKFQLPPEDAEIATAITDARADTWAQLHNKTPEEWYNRIAGVEAELRGDTVWELKPTPITWSYAGGDVTIQIPQVEALSGPGQPSPTQLQRGVKFPFEQIAPRFGAETSSAIKTALDTGATEGSFTPAALQVRKMESPILAQTEMRQRQEGVKAPATNFYRDLLEAGDVGIILRAFETGANLRHTVHELGHVFMHDLTDADYRTAAEWAGATPSGDTWVWNVAAREKFADGFVDYVGGQQTTPGKLDTATPAEVAGVFAKFKNWLRGIYFAVKDDIPADMRQVYDNLFAGATYEPTTKAAQKALDKLKAQSEQEARNLDLESSIAVLEQPTAEPDYIAEEAPTVTPEAPPIPAEAFLEQPEEVKGVYDWVDDTITLREEDPLYRAHEMGHQLYTNRGLFEALGHQLELVVGEGQTVLESGAPLSAVEKAEGKALEKVFGNVAETPLELYSNAIGLYLYNAEQARSVAPELTNKIRSAFAEKFSDAEITALRNLIVPTSNITTPPPQAPQVPPAQSEVRAERPSGVPEYLDYNIVDEAKPMPLVYRGVTDTEAQAIIKSKYIGSEQQYSVPGEGTSFAQRWDDAESYINFGRDNPAKTGKPTYILEVHSSDDMVVDKRDGYPKAQEPISADRINRAWRLNPDGSQDEVTPLFKPQEATIAEPRALTQWKPEVIAAINKELSTIKGFTGLTEADLASPEKLEKARQWALIRLYKKQGRLLKAKNVAGLKAYEVFGQEVPVEIKPRLPLLVKGDLPRGMRQQLIDAGNQVTRSKDGKTRYIRGANEAMQQAEALLNQAGIPFTSEAVRLRQQISADIQKKVAAEFPAPKPPTGLTKTQEKQVAQELQAGVNAVLKRMGRRPDGSMEYKKGRGQDSRYFYRQGNIIRFKDTENKEWVGSLELTDEQMEDAVQVFTGIEEIAGIRRLDQFMQNLKGAYAITHGISRADMDAVADVAQQRNVDFHEPAFRRGLAALLLKGGVEGNQRLVQLGLLIESGMDLNKVNKKLGRYATTPKPGQATAPQMGGIVDKNLVSMLTVLRKKGGKPGAEFGNRLVEGLQERSLIDNKYKSRFRDGVYLPLREFYDPQVKGLPGKRVSAVNQRVRNSMRRIERFLDDMQGRGTTSVTLNQAETTALNNLQALKDDMWTDAYNAEVITKEEYDTRYIEYYLPKQWDLSATEIENKKDAAINKIAQDKGIDHTQAAKLWNRFIKSKRDRIAYSLEEERLLDDAESGIRGLEERMYRYIEESARRQAEVRTFGKGDAKLTALLARLTANDKTHGDFATTVRDLALGLDAKDASDKIESKQVSHLRGGIAASLLQWSWVQNLTEPALLTMRTSLRDALKAGKKSLVDAKLAQEFAEDAAAIPVTNAKSTLGRIFSKSEADYITLQEGYDTGEGRFSRYREFMFRLQLFTPSERFIKIVEANAAVEYGNRMLRRLAKGKPNNWAKTRLAELVNTLDGNEADTLIQAAGKDQNVTLDKLAQSKNAEVAQLANDAMQRAGLRVIDELSMGPSGILRRPMNWTKGPYGRLIFQFKSWSFQVTRMAKEELRRGGIRSWLKLAAVFYPASVVVTLAERLAGRVFFGKDLPEDETEWLWNIVAAPFLVGLGGIYYRGLHTAATRPEYLAAELLPPVLAVPLRLGTAGVQDVMAAAKGEPTFRFGKEALRLVPVVGRPAAGYLQRAKRAKKTTGNI